MTNRQLKLLKKKYLREGYKMGLKEAIKNKSNRKRLNESMENRLASEVRQSIIDALNDGLGEVGGLSEVVDFWAETLEHYDFTKQELLANSSEIAEMFLDLGEEFEIDNDLLYGIYNHVKSAIRTSTAM